MKNGVSLVLFATFGLALKGIWARLAYAEGLDVSGVLFYRSLLSAPLVVLSAWYLLRRESMSRLSSAHKPMHASPSFRDYVPGILLGMLFSVGMMCDFQAIAHLGASVSRVILFGFPLVVMVVDALISRVLPPSYRLFGFALAWLGLFGVAGTASWSGASGSGFGNVSWALASMLFYALYVWSAGRFTKKLGSVRLTLSSNLATSFVVVTFLLLRDHGAVPAITNAALEWIIAMVFVSTVFPYFLMMEGIKRLGSTEASLLAMTGPVITIAAGGLLLGEEMSPLQLLGTGATLVGVAVAQGKIDWRALMVRPLLNANKGLCSKGR